MYDVRTSAPGKLFLSGEYAVLQGAPAVIDSVDRRVAAVTVRENIPQSTLIKHVKDEVARFMMRRTGSAVGQLPNVEIDSTGFTMRRRKLGIGSSAAVAAATTGALFEWVGLSVADHRSDVFTVADAAHRAYQGGSGSGADVATSVYGGTVVFKSGETVLQAAPLNVHKVFVWTGDSASTVSLVGEVKKVETGAPQLYASLMERLVTLAQSLAAGYLEGDAAMVISLTRAYGEQMKALGEAAGVSIVTPAMVRIAGMAEEAGGACKPSGAGGGDAAMALFLHREDAVRFCEQMKRERFDVLQLRTGVSGLRREA